MRLVRFVDPENAALCRDQLSPEESLEIETKAGHFVHLRLLHPEHEDGCLTLQPGPATPRGSAARPSTAPTRRQWQDLSERLAGAFDGRPTILSLEPTTGAQENQPAGAAKEPAAAARRWVLRLSTGYRITCRWANGELALTGEYRK